jgi:hypothetical protein
LQFRYEIGDGIEFAREFFVLLLLGLREDLLEPFLIVLSGVVKLIHYVTRVSVRLESAAATRT